MLCVCNDIEVPSCCARVFYQLYCNGWYVILSMTGDYMLKVTIANQLSRIVDVQFGSFSPSDNSTANGNQEVPQGHTEIPS